MHCGDGACGTDRSICATQRPMWIVAGTLLVVLGGILLIVFRRPMADLQAMLAGGSITPGCAVAEGIALIALAIVIYVLERGS